MRCMIYERVGEVKRTILIEGTLAEVTGLIDEFQIIDRPVEIVIDPTLNEPLVSPIDVPDCDDISGSQHARGATCMVWPTCKCVTRRQCVGM